MARARNIKPGFFKNELIAEMPPETRLMFIGLWCIADREGRFEDRPKKIKMELFPCDDFSIEDSLALLARDGFLIRYEAEGKRYAQVVNFTKHQMPHHKEVSSEIPPPPGMDAVTRHGYDVPNQVRELVFDRDGRACLKCGSDQSLSLDHIKPLASGGDNSVDNLQTLCGRCNSSKGNSTKDYRKTVDDSTLNQARTNVEPTLNQARANAGAPCRTDSLIPDSLIPESCKPLTTFGGAGGTQAQHEPEPTTASPLAPPPMGDESAFADQPLQSNEPKRSRGTRLTASWFLPKAWGEWALAEKPSWTPEHVRKVSDRFRDHWIAAAGRTGVKLDWEATWRNWVRKEPELNGARAAPYGQRRNFLAEAGILGDGT
jgi:hypothetical protein